MKERRNYRKLYHNLYIKFLVLKGKLAKAEEAQKQLEIIKRQIGAWKP